MFLILGLLFQLAIVGGIVYAIVSAVRGRSGRGRAPRSSAISVRRLFQYALLLVALSIAASGVSGVLSRVISDAAARRDSELAGPLAMLVTGVPVFMLLGRWIWNQLLTDRAERNSVGWSFYINATLVGSLIAAVSLAFAIADRFIAGDGYDGTLVAPFLVAVGVWIGHWVAWRRVPPGILSDLHVMAGAAIGLGSLAGGGGFIIASAIDRAFDRSIDVGRFSGDNLTMAGVAILVGAAVWAWHWLFNGLPAKRTNVWLAYVILIGILGGLLAAVIGGSTALFLVLQWIFGSPDSSSAAAHFQDASPAVAAVVIGVAVWFYHKAILGFDRARERTDMDRLYDYVVSGVALATVAGALTTLIVAVFRVLQTDDAVSNGDSDIVIAAVTLLLVGAPLWAVAWRRAQRAAVADPTQEATAPARRVYLFAVFGIGGAIAFGAITRLAFVLFEAILGERSGGGLIDDLSVPIALLLTTGAIAAYHWSIYRAERNAPEPVCRRDVTLVWAGGDAATIEQLASVRVNVVLRRDDTFAPTEAIVAAIDGAEGDPLLVVVGQDNVDAIPIEAW